ncbi:MAG: tetratricopeptide repeat-containing diguanylate cyclase [Cellulosilyticaceae bacterium]
MISAELKALAESYLRQGDSQKALDLYRELLVVTTAAQEILSLKISISKVYILLGEYTEALAYATESSLIAQEMNYQEEVGQAYQLIGSIHFRLKKFERAIPYFEDALQIYVTRHDFEKVACISNNIGVAYLDAGDFKQAEKYFSKTLELAHLIAEPYPLGLAYTNRGEIYLKQHQFDEAVINFFEAIDIYKELEIALCIAYTYLRLSEAYMHKGYLVLALEYAHEAMRMQTKMQDQYELSACYRHLSKLYEMKSDFKRALDYYKRYSKIELDLAHQDTQGQVVQMEREFKEKEQALYKEKMLELEAVNHKLHSAYEQIKELSMTDMLTQVYNRRGFLEHIKGCGQEAKESLRSLMIIDIDNFKQINDTYGHVVGDKVLVYTAQVLKTIFANEGIVCRYGGEEFIVLISQCDLDQAQLLAEAVACTIQKDCVVSLGLEYTVTIGIHTASRLALEEQIDRADQCLYAGKQSTKNCIICSTA